MVDLQFVDFALMPGPPRKENQFGLPDNFSIINVAVLSWLSHPVSGFPANGLLFSDPQNVLPKQEISTFLFSEVEIVTY